MMDSGVAAAQNRSPSRKRRRDGAPKSQAAVVGASPVRSIRLCDEASLVLREAGWRKGDLQRRLTALASDAAALSAVDVLSAKSLADRERHRTRTTSARIDQADYERLFSMATDAGVSVWAYLNQAIIDKYGPPSPL